MIWKVYISRSKDEIYKFVFVQADSFDEAIKYARMIDERYDTAQVVSK
nr:MAG TPA: protein of unknown function DUF4288 [Caudoviricetes sp.]